jgi:hypothetical protein
MLKLQKGGSLQKRSRDFTKVQNFHRAYQQVFNEKWRLQKGTVEPNDTEKVLELRTGRDDLPHRKEHQQWTLQILCQGKKKRKTMDRAQ